jgi:argininosuccinate synthase
VKAVASSKVKKVVLAYSGGLDTSVILKWLQDTYGCEVVTFTADLGQVSTSSNSRSRSSSSSKRNAANACMYVLPAGALQHGWHGKCCCDDC